MCRPKENSASTRVTYIDLCGSNMKSWTRSMIASQAQEGVLMPIIIVVLVGLGLRVLIGVVGAIAHQLESR